MLSNIRKIIAGLGLAALCVAPAVAGSFSMSITGGSWSGSVNVPSAGNCTQYLLAPNGGQVWVPETRNSQGYIIANGYYVPLPLSTVVCSGPLGMHYINGPSNSKLVQGPIPAGTYGVYLQVDNGGCSVVGISW